MVTVTILVHRQVRRATIEVAADRLGGVTDLLATLLAAPADARFAAIRSVADDSLISDFVAGRGNADTAAVRVRVEGYATAQTALVELWDAAGSRIFGGAGDVPDTPPMTGAPRDRVLSRLGDRPAIIGQYEVTPVGILYPVAATVTRDGAVVGYVVERRMVAGSPDELRQLSGLIGTDARLLIGNADGELWTDFNARVTGPVPDPRNVRAIRRYERDDGSAVLAGLAPVPSTPWVLAIEFPESTVLGPADRMFASVGGVLFLLVIAGAGAGALMTRRMTVPLNRLTAAAEANATGGGPVHVPVEREDEIGRLAAAFNTMVDRVDESRHVLELRVAERTAALEAANRELEAFGYSVSHDLRAPLRAVDGFAAVLDEDHGATLPEDARRCIGLIRQSAQQMGQLIDDLLTFSRLARQSMAPASIDMNELAGVVVDEVCGPVGARTIDITVESLPPGTGERTMVKQVLANYVQNAVKFSRSQPTPRVVIGAESLDGGVAYFVRDNGVGFDMRYAGKLFGVFQRLHAAEEFEGTGVGLAIVQRIVHRHGGRVWAIGEPDRGATFYFTLDAQPADAASEPGNEVEWST